MPWSRIPKLGPVEEIGPYVRRTDGMELLRCDAIVEDSGVPLAVIKSEIEQKYMKGRHFYRGPNCFLVERPAYEAWKAERLPFVRRQLDREGGWPLFLPPRREPVRPPQRPARIAKENVDEPRAAEARPKRWWREVVRRLVDHPPGE